MRTLALGWNTSRECIPKTCDISAFCNRFRVLRLSFAVSRLLLLNVSCQKIQ